MKWFVQSLLALTYTMAFAGAISFSLIDLYIWFSLPDWWHQKTFRHDLMGSELRHGLWTVRQQIWFLIVWPLAALFLILVFARAQIGTSLGKTIIAGLFVYCVAMIIFVWPFIFVADR